MTPTRSGRVARCLQRRCTLAVALLAIAGLGLGACGDGGGTSLSAAPTSPRSTTTTTSETPTTTTTTTAPEPPSPSPAGNPWPAIAAVPAQHHAVLAIDDSTLGQSVYSLAGVLANHGFDAVVYDAHINGAGLLDPMDGVSARDFFEQQLALHPDVDTVIFEWEGVCAVACGAGKLAYGSPEFFDAWQAAARALVVDARSHGIAVVWAVGPPQAPSNTDASPEEDWFSLPMRRLASTVLAMYARQYQHDFGVTVADWWQALSDREGQWQQQLWYDNALHTVRVDDHVHLTDDGSFRTSIWTAAALADLYNELAALSSMAVLPFDIG